MGTYSIPNPLTVIPHTRNVVKWKETNRKEGETLNHPLLSSLLSELQHARWSPSFPSSHPPLLRIYLFHQPSTHTHTHPHRTTPHSVPPTIRPFHLSFLNQTLRLVWSDFSHWPNHSLIHSLIHSLTHSLAHWRAKQAECGALFNSRFSCTPTFLPFLHPISYIPHPLRTEIDSFVISASSVTSTQQLLPFLGCPMGSRDMTLLLPFFQFSHETSHKQSTRVGQSQSFFFLFSLSVFLSFFSFFFLPPGPCLLFIFLFLPFFFFLLLLVPSYLFSDWYYCVYLYSLFSILSISLFFLFLFFLAAALSFDTLFSLLFLCTCVLSRLVLVVPVPVPVCCLQQADPLSTPIKPK